MFDDITVAIDNDHDLYSMVEYVVNTVPPQGRGDAIENLVLVSVGFDRPDLSPLVRQVFGSQGREFWDRVADYYTATFSEDGRAS
jgi:hypothetical protein